MRANFRFYEMCLNLVFLLFNNIFVSKYPSKSGDLLFKFLAFGNQMYCNSLELEYYEINRIKTDDQSFKALKI